MVAAAGSGPQAIPYKTLTSQKIADAIRFCLSPDAMDASQKIAMKMRAESGVQTAVASFHRNLPRKRMECDILPGQAAAWVYKHGKQRVKLSRMAAQALSACSELDLQSLR